ncbi:hypothetical protein DACRYDRAFT_117533 [Dacryopinax primogenitus]|uniref:DUF336-domain-containing protein n=1 Tax=Dacryopinax primogenitus (strain DJM 731) TaxID=1858805 RepID=M5FRR6_DACPD|nr:uncharacterized protein DACRYDRAFT_117533 [Dacryopinax primogenitus]EJT99905.1 hypothetical protein DACRYDRAFT_117533 [Dacryopinax primogenitus]
MVLLGTAEEAKLLVPEIEAQESKLHFPAFTTEVAWQVGTAIRARFLATQAWKEKGIVVHISTFTGHVLFTCAVGKESAINPGNWINGKMNVVKRFNHSSFFVGRNLVSQGKVPEEALPFPEFAAHGGAFPVWIKGAPCSPLGTIIVSGLKQEEDHQIIVDTLEEILPTLQ